MPASQTNKELARLFERAANVLDLKGDNRFRAAAFQRVGRVLEDLNEDVRAVFDRGGLKAVEAIKGIGASSGKMIADYLSTGRSVDYDELVASIPEGLLTLLEIPGMGPKTVQAVWQQKGVTSVDQLAAAIADGSLGGIKGLGAKKLEQIRQGIEMLDKAGQRRGVVSAMAVAVPMLQRLRELSGVERAEYGGSLRRFKETIGDLDFLVTVKEGTKPGEVLKAFSKFPEADRILGLGESKCSLLTHDGLQVDCRVVPPRHFGAAYLYFTGSKDHNIRLRGMALDRGHTLNEWGIYPKEGWEQLRKKPGEPPAIESEVGDTEADVYAWFGMQWVPPELREDRGEIEAALEGKLPTLIEPGDYRGDLHTHTTASDGTSSIEEMAEAAKALGYAYLAITDHSKSQFQANGLDAKRLAKHAEAIRAANERIKGIELLVGTECDILSDGTLDYEDAVLAELDWVVASPHVALRQDTVKATERILRAIDNPYVCAIGHPTGRLINKRNGLPLDMAKVITRAAETYTALEINVAYPRFDLSDIHARMAVDAGCMLTINTDAHSTQGLPSVADGLGIARRAWVTKAHVLNCQTLAQVRKFIAKKRP